MFHSLRLVVLVMFGAAINLHCPTLKLITSKWVSVGLIFWRILVLYHAYILKVLLVHLLLHEYSFLFHFIFSVRIRFELIQILYAYISHGCVRNSFKCVSNTETMFVKLTKLWWGYPLLTINNMHGRNDILAEGIEMRQASLLSHVSRWWEQTWYTYCT